MSLGRAEIARNTFSCSEIQKSSKRILHTFGRQQKCVARSARSVVEMRYFASETRSSARRISLSKEMNTTNLRAMRASHFLLAPEK